MPTLFKMYGVRQKIYSFNSDTVLSFRALYSIIFIIIIEFIVSRTTLNIYQTHISSSNHDTMGTSEASKSLFKLVPDFLLKLRQIFHQI